MRTSNQPEKIKQPPRVIPPTITTSKHLRGVAFGRASVSRLPRPRLRSREEIPPARRSNPVRSPIKAQLLSAAGSVHPGTSRTPTTRSSGRSRPPRFPEVRRDRASPSSIRSLSPRKPISNHVNLDSPWGIRWAIPLSRAIA